MKGSQRSRVHGLPHQSLKARSAPRALCIMAFGMLVLAGCGEYKPPKFSEIVDSVQGKEEKPDESKSETKAAATTETGIAADSTPVAPAKQTSPRVEEPVAEPAPVQKANPEQVAADFAARKYQIFTDQELIALRDGIGDRLDLITRIDADGNKVTVRGMAIIGEFVHLKDLNLANLSMTQDGWEYLEKLVELEKLSLYGSSINDEELVHLRPLTKLVDLNLAQCKQTTDQGHYYLEALDNLEVLDISGNQKINGGGFLHVRDRKGLNKLRELIANGTQFGMNGMGGIQNLKSLETLEIGNCGVQNPGLGAFRKCTGIKRLLLGQNQGLSDVGLAELARLKQLEHLRLNNLPLVTNEGLSYVKGAKNLQFVNVEGTRINDDGMRALKKLIPKVTIKHSRGEIQ